MKSPLIFLTLALVGLVACSREKAAKPAGGHAHHAPHGGVLVELGEHQFNLELVFDETRGVLQAWVLDGHAEVFVRMDLPAFEIEATAGAATHMLRFSAVGNSMTDESPGNTSQFEASAEWLRTAKAFDGRVKEITVRGVRFTDITFHFSPHDKDHEHRSHP